MTIFRSELTAAALLLAVSAAAQAQGVQRPIQQAQQAGAQPAAAPQAAPSPGSVTMSSPGQDATLTQGQTPASHTVRQGDTLWALAQQYLGDPMLWPEIYRLNTNVVEDPHWIYPGEELRITPEAGGEVAAASPTEPASPSAAPAAAPSGDTAVVVSQGMTVTPSASDSFQAASQDMAPAPTSGPTVFNTTNQRVTTQLQVAGQHAYRAVREGEYYAAGFLTENHELNHGLILANAETAIRGSFRTRTSAQMYDNLIVQPPQGETMQNNDLFLSYRRGDEISDFGQIIVPTGLLKVNGQRGPYYQAQVIRIFSPMQDSQEVIKIAPFVNNSEQRAQPVSNGIAGRVLRLRDGGDVAQMQNVVLLNKGANDGLRLGDIVQIYVQRGDTTNVRNLEQDQARAIIVNTRAATSTAVIVELYRQDISALSSFRQIRRMPS